MSKTFAILGDIHANIDALNAVLDDCRAEGVTDFLCTGDVVGYNACPHECLEVIRGLGCPVVKGNHDYYVSADASLDDFNPAAAFVVEWTRRQLAADEMTWLRELPFTMTRMGVTLVHGTMDNPGSFGYVFGVDEAATSFVRQMTPLCFHGHTHCPMIYEKSQKGVFRIDPQDMVLPVGRKYFVNVGSVGQPRNGDPRAAYFIYEPAERRLRFRTVPYDIAAAQERIRRAGLPERLAERLEYGN